MIVSMEVVTYWTVFVYFCGVFAGVVAERIRVR